jgi:hypothetical protein
MPTNYAKLQVLRRNAFWPFNTRYFRLGGNSIVKNPIRSKLNCAVWLCEKKTARETELNVVVEMTNTMNRFAPLLYSIYRLLHVSVVVYHHQGASGSVWVTWKYRSIWWYIIQCWLSGLCAGVSWFRLLCFPAQLGTTTAQVSHQVCQLFCQFCWVLWDDAIVVSAGKLRKLWDSLSELRTSLCGTTGKDSSEAFAIACQHCVVYSVFPSGMTSHSKIAQFNWECVGRLRCVLRDMIKAKTCSHNI